MKRNERVEKQLLKHCYDLTVGADEIVRRYKRYAVVVIVFGGVSLGVVAGILEDMPVHPVAFFSICVLQGILIGMGIVLLTSVQQMPILAQHLDQNSIRARLEELGEVVEQGNEPIEN